MQQLLYVSNTGRDVEQSVLDDILASAQRNNAGLNVTGMLLYVDGGFLQILEGDADVLNSLYRVIAEDKRHWNTQVLLRRDAPRAFRDWSMGFHRVSAQSEREMFKISSDAIGGHLATDGGVILLRLMENFYRIQSGEKRFPVASAQGG